MSTPAQTRIRHFRHSDVGSLRQLICETIDVSYSSVYPPRAVAFFKEFHAEQKIVERGRIGTVLVAEENGELIATGSLVDGEIFAVFVHPDNRRSGLGRALMRTLEDRARAAGRLSLCSAFRCHPRDSTKALDMKWSRRARRMLGAGNN